MSAGAETHFHFIPAPFSGSTFPQNRQTGGGGRGRAACIWAAAVFPASMAKSHRMQQMSPWKRDAGETRVSAPHIPQSAYQFPKTRMVRPNIGTHTRGTSQLVVVLSCSKHDFRSRRNLATSEEESCSAAAVMVSDVEVSPALRLEDLHIVDTMVAGLRSTGKSGLTTGSNPSSSRLSAAASSVTAVRNAADDRLAHRICPSYNSPSMVSMLAAKPNSLNGWFFPELSCTELTIRRHSGLQGLRTVWGSEVPGAPEISFCFFSSLKKK